MRDTEYSDEDLMKSHYYDEEEHRNSLSGQIWRNDHERQIVLDLEAMTATDEFWGRALASAVLRIWRELSAQLAEARLAQYDTNAKLHQANQRILALKNENDKFRRALFAWVIAEKEGGHYSKAQELRGAALAALEQQEAPEMKGPDLTGIERECCGTFHGTPHRSTCEKWRGKKTPNA